MALQISYEDATGTTHASSYTRVLILQINRVAGEAKVQVGTYHDSAARSAGKDTVATVNYTFTGATYTSMFGNTNLDLVNENPTKVVYDEIKTYGEWTGASDV